MRLARQKPQHFRHWARQRALPSNLLCELNQLFPIGQLAIQQQVCDLLKTRLLRHFVNVVTPIHQPGVGIDPADRRFSCNNAGQSGAVFWFRFSSHWFSLYLRIAILQLTGLNQSMFNFRRPDRNRASRKVPAASASCRSNRIASRSSLVPQKTFHSLSSKRERHFAEKSPYDTRTPRAVESSTAGFFQTQSCSRATAGQFPSQNRETPRRFATPREKSHRRRRRDIRPLARPRDRNLRPRARPFAR